MSLLIFFGNLSAGVDNAVIALSLKLSRDAHLRALAKRNAGYMIQADLQIQNAVAQRDAANAADPLHTAPAWADEARHTTDLQYRTFYGELGYATTAPTGGTVPPVLSPPAPGGTAGVAASIQEALAYYREAMLARRDPDTTYAETLYQLAYDLLIAADATDPLHETAEWGLFDYDEVIAFLEDGLGI